MQLLCFGDSIARGYGVPFGMGWVERVSAAFPTVHVENHGIDGDTLQGMIYRLERLARSTSKSTYISIMGSTNDILMGRNSTYCFEKMKHLIQLIREKGGTPIVGKPPQIDGDLDGINIVLLEYVNQLRHYCERQSITYIDFYQAIEDTTKDGTIAFAGEVHPNRLGHEVMGQTAISTLKTILE